MQTKFPIFLSLSRKEKNAACKVFKGLFDVFTTFPLVQQVAVCRALAITSSNKKSLKRLSLCLCKYLSKWKEASVRVMHFVKYATWTLMYHREKGDMSQHDKSAEYKHAQEAQRHALPMTVYTISAIHFRNHPLLPNVSLASSFSLNHN